MKRPLIAIALTAFLPASALAAVDGSLGDTSTGSLNLTLNVTSPPPSGRQISGLQDLKIDTVVGTIPTPASTTLCVYEFPKPTLNSNAFITIDAMPFFDAQSQVSVPYTVTFQSLVTNDSFSLDVGNESVSDVSAFGNPQATSTSEKCANGGPNAELTVSFSDAPTQVGTATATIMITLGPD